MASQTEPGPPDGAGLAAFNAMGDVRARETLLACCRAPGWADAVAAGRPYPSLPALLERAAAVLTDADVAEALDGHPRIGAVPAGTGAAQSRREQARVAGADDDTLAALAAGNEAYERRFGHIYLVCAAGRSAAELLANLRERLRNDPDTEGAVVRDELRKINAIRLGKLISP